MIQLILHLFGDYVTQSDWMALNKSKRSWPAFCHALVYSLPFAFIVPGTAAWAAIFVTHFLIDRYRLARFVVWVKNFLGAPATWHPWAECTATGYHQDTPPYLSIWLMIAADNTMHLGINAAAIAWLR